MSIRFLITSNDLRVGGAERQRVHLANALAARGHEVTLMLMKGPNDMTLAELVSPAVMVRSAPWWRAGAGGLDRPLLIVSGTTNTEVGYAFRMRRASPRFAGRRWVVAAHTPPVPDGPTYSRELARAIRMSDGVIALARAHWNELTANQDLGERVFIVPNGVDPQTFPPRPPSDTTVRICFLGRLVESKGVQFVIEALSELPQYPWIFDVYGVGPYSGHLADLIPPALSGRIRLAGYTDDPAGTAGQYDLFVLPSRTEAQPMSLLEAMSAGVPVMAHPVAAVPEMLADGGGVLVPEQTAASWRQALEPYLRDPRLLAPLGERGLLRSRVFSEKSMVDGYEAVADMVFSRTNG
ncbi:MAG TPA: glycosyltransferase family 4 protein [Actinomycetota bacterium]|nr:glycosyltransferase family 4 protein [Actinomycetota bacterium]HRY09860.1 glycosyltransferase family 4 protein [Candidatus Nanopelagicales bacterium]